MRAGDRIDCLDGSDEAVPAPRQGFDELWCFGGIAKRLTDLLDRRVQAVLEIDERVGCPQSPPKLLARNQVPGPLQQRDEYLSWLLLEPNASAAGIQVTRGLIQLETTEPDARRS